MGMGQREGGVAATPRDERGAASEVGARETKRRHEGQNHGTPV
jgi:hypothetical protein